MLLEVTKQKEVKETLEVSIPSYFKCNPFTESGFIAILSEDTAIRVYGNKDYFSAERGTPEFLLKSGGDRLTPCTAEEFETAYNECLNQFNIFQPAA